MTTSSSTKLSTDRDALAVKMIVDAWKTQNSRVSSLLHDLSDEQLLREAAPGRNTGLYLLGHLTAVSDGLLPLFGSGERRFPALEEHFIKNPDTNLLKDRPTPAEVRKAWAEIIGLLQENFDKTSTDAWFEKHTAVSDEDFEKEPHRNRLNVLISRTNHQSYHLAQLGFLIERSELAD